MTASIHRFPRRRVKRLIPFNRDSSSVNRRIGWTLAVMILAMPPICFAGLMWIEIYFHGYTTPLVTVGYPVALVWALIGGGVLVKWWQATK